MERQPPAARLTEHLDQTRYFLPLHLLVVVGAVRRQPALQVALAAVVVIGVVVHMQVALATRPAHHQLRVLLVEQGLELTLVAAVVAAQQALEQTEPRLAAVLAAQELHLQLQVHQ